MRTGKIAIVHHDEENASWTMACAGAHPGLAGDVIAYTGYREQASGPVRRRELPSARVPVIISFGPTIELVGGTAGPFAEVPLTSFVAGFSDGYAITEYVGPQYGVQVDLTPLGAYRLLGVTGAEIRNGVVHLEDVLGRSYDELLERLGDAPEWSERFAVLDDFLLQREARGRPVDDAVAWSWHRLSAAGGSTSIGRLAEEVGWSRRHFANRFQRHVGLTPKAAARVLRFERAARMLDVGRTISDVAADAGYADHSHLVREFREMAGCTPSQLAAERRGDSMVSVG